MSTSQLSLYNAALFLLKHNRLTNLTNNVEARYALDNVYADVKAYCLEQGLWNFALRSVSMEASVDEETFFGFKYVYDKPDDYVRLNAISANESFWPTLNEYLDEATYWLCDVNPLYISYISDDDEFGNNLGEWPMSYTRYVEHELAYRIAPHITSMGDQSAKELERRRLMALRDAQAKDAMNQPMANPPPGRLLRARSQGSRVAGRPWWR